MTTTFNYDFQNYDNNYTIVNVIDGVPIFEITHPLTRFIFYHNYKTIDNPAYIAIYADSYECVSNYIFYNPSSNKFYTTKKDAEVVRETVFPYNFYSYVYGVQASIRNNDISIALYNIKSKMSKFNYSIGIEYETCCGYIPEWYCMTHGLVPLRDGSINGLEYASVVLTPDKVNNAIDVQCEHLHKYCNYNKECSTHIHFGNYPLNSKSIFTLYKVLYLLQNDLSRIFSECIFQTSAYKASGKDYTKELCAHDSFDTFYKYLSMGSKYLGSIYENHPACKGRESKWNITTRYHWVNFINLLFFPSGKTVEFRFLPPTTNAIFIKTWVVILSKVLNFAQKISKSNKINTITELTFESIITSTCTKKQSDILIGFLNDVQKCYMENDIYNYPHLLQQTVFKVPNTLFKYLL